MKHPESINFAALLAGVLLLAGCIANGDRCACDAGTTIEAPQPGAVVRLVLRDQLRPEYGTVASVDAEAIRLELPHGGRAVFQRSAVVGWASGADVEGEFAMLSEPDAFRRDERTHREHGGSSARRVDA